MIRNINEDFIHVPSIFLGWLKKHILLKNFGVVQIVSILFNMNLKIVVGE